MLSLTIQNLTTIFVNTIVGTLGFVTATTILWIGFMLILEKNEKVMNWYVSIWMKMLDKM